MLGLTMLSWIVSFIKAIRRKRDEKYLEDDVVLQIAKRQERWAYLLTKFCLTSMGICLIQEQGEPVVYGRVFSSRVYDDTGQ